MAVPAGSNAVKKSVLRVTTLLTSLVLLGLAVEAVARPETIRPGHSYYSDAYVTRGLVRDIVGEKNLEEVYQFYSYYEVVYDESERVVRFTEYERGEVLAMERYRYGADGRLVERVVERPGAPPEVTTPEPSRAEAGEGPAH
jgi:hypothetical protein